jgi:hypothetical protein
MNCPVCCSFTCVCDDGSVFLDRNFEYETTHDTQIETLTKQRDMLLEALKECSEDLMSWGEYAGEYFQNKHDLKGTFAKYQAIIKQVESER